MILKKFNNHTLATQAKKGEQLVFLMPAFRKYLLIYSVMT